MASERKADPTPSSAWRYIVKDLCPADCAIAIRAHWEDQIVDIHCHARWTATLLCMQSAGCVALVSGHFPTRWGTEERWVEALEALSGSVSRWKAGNEVREVILVADWNLQRARAG